MFVSLPVLGCLNAAHKCSVAFVDGLDACVRDACIKTIVDFNALLGDQMLGMTMTGVVLDASDNPWFVLVDGATQCAQLSRTFHSVS
jgi:NaMN:DMB phosphoribosyltransferase